MRSRFLLNGTEHEVWLSRRQGGYRLHAGGVEDGIEVALEASRADPHPAGGGGAPYPKKAHPTPLARVYPPLQGRDQRGGGASQLTIKVEACRSPVLVATSGDDIHIHLDGRTHLVRYLDPVRSLAGDAQAGADEGSRAPMPGTVVAVHVEPGVAVSPGDALLVIESMKLETTIRATRAGIVDAVHVHEGQSFERDQLLVSLAKGS